MPSDGSALRGNDTLVTLQPWSPPAGFVVPDPPADAAALGEALLALARTPRGEPRGEPGAEAGGELPLPGRGRTAARFAALGEVSAVDLSLGRLFEGHADAVAILDEAGRQPPPGAVMGVWAARRPGTDLVAFGGGSGWRLRGAKPWASGAETLTHALVTAATDGGDCLFEVPLDGKGVAIVPGTWPAVGMALSQSADVELDIALGPDALVGPPGWYIERPGFWFGSVGVAGCWLGGALGLVRALRSDLAGRPQPDPHQLAHLGAAAARCASMARDIEWAAGRIDACPADPDRAIRAVALEVRHLVEDGCLAVLVHVGRAGGAGPLCQDPAQARRAADLPVYIRQHHAERDDEELGRGLLSPPARRGAP